MEEACCNRTCVAVALDADARALEGHTDTSGRLAGDKQDARRGGVVTTFTTADRERFAGDDSGHGVPFMHGVGIHNPRHHLGVGVDIGRGNIPMGTDNDGNLGSIATGETFQFGRAHMLGIADDATFRASEGYGYDRAFPGHPHCERFHFIQRHIGAIANAPFGRATIDIVLDTIACKGLDAAIVEAHRKIDGKFTFGLTQNLSHIL